MAISWKCIKMKLDGGGQAVKNFKIKLPTSYSNFASNKVGLGFFFFFFEKWKKFPLFD